MNYAGPVDRKEATSHWTCLCHIHLHFPRPGRLSITDVSVFGEEGPGKRGLLRSNILDFGELMKFSKFLSLDTNFKLPKLISIS